MQTFEVRVPDLPRGDEMPVRFTDEDGGGDNRSLPLHIDALPAGTQSVAFILVDKDSSDRVHWLVVDVPAGDIRLQEGASRRAMPAGTRELYNAEGFQGYQGPDPNPRTGKHRYELTAYALDEASLAVDEHAGLDEFRRAAEPHAIAKGQNYWRWG